MTTIKEFQILKGNSTSANCVYRHSQKTTISYVPDQSVFKILLEAPITISKSQKYSVFLIIEGSHTYKCVDCLQTITGHSNIKWDFENTLFSQTHQNNRCDIVCGPIADFYYIID